MSLSQLTRQWLILQELAASRMGRTLLSLARAGGVHERTARRDVYALMDAGFPIEKVEESEPVRFRFVPGRNLPQVPLDFAEAMALYQAVVTSPVAQNPAFHPLVEAGLHKIIDAFPREIREYLGRFRAAYFHQPQPAPESDLLSALRILQKQITYSARVRFDYCNLEGVATTRTVDPYLIHPKEGAFYLVGYCHLRGDHRIFRIDCITNLTPLSEEFSLPAGFDPAVLLRTSLGVHLGEAQTAVVLFEGTAARYFQRSPIHPAQNILEQDDDHLLVELPIRGIKEVTELVLKYGDEAEIIAPAALRQHLKTTLAATARRYLAD